MEADYWQELAKRMENLDPSMFPKNIDPELLESLMSNPDLFQPDGDLDGDGIPNIRDPDADNDGIPDGEELEDGTLPYFNDSNWNRFYDGAEREFWENAMSEAERRLGDPDVDQEALREFLDDPARGGPDGDLDGDGTSNYLDDDADGDGLPDGAELALGLLPFLLDTDGDGVTDGGEPVDGTERRSNGAPEERTLPTETTVDTIDQEADLGGTFNVTGRVLDPEGRGVGGALVDLFVNHTKSEPGLHAGRGFTDGAGRYAIRAEMPAGAEPGDNHIVAHGVPRAPHLDSWSDPIIQVYSATQLNLQLFDTIRADEPLRFSGTLTDAGGKPVSGRTVRVFFDHREAAILTTTSAGTFRVELPGAQLGQHDVFAVFAGETYLAGSTDRRTVHAIEGSTALVIASATERVHRGEFAELEGTLHDDTGAPVPQASLVVSLEGPDGAVASTQAATDSGGAWSAALLVPKATPIGDARLIAAFPGLAAYAGAEAASPVVVAQEKVSLTVEADPRLVRGRDAVRAFLVDLAGEPLVGREVRFSVAEATVRHVTDARGSAVYELPTSLALGPHELVVAYDEDLRYAPAESRTTVTVASATVVQAASTGSAVAGSEATFRVAVRDDLSNQVDAGTLTARFGDAVQEVDIATNDGLVRFVIPRNLEGRVPYEFVFAGNATLEGSGAESTVDVASPPLVVFGQPAAVVFPAGAALVAAMGGLLVVQTRRRREMAKFRSILERVLDDLAHGADARRAVIEAYAEFVQWAEASAAGVGEATLTPRERAERVTAAVPEFAAEIERITSLYERARHAVDPISPEARAEAVEALSRLLNVDPGGSP